MAEDKPVKQMLRVVHLLDCVAGYAGDENGPPIVILTWGDHAGNVEQPLMVSLEDTRRLVTDLLVALADHGDEVARMLLDRYFGG